MTPPPAIGAHASSQKDFDVKSFCDKTHDFGRAYWHRAIELIKCCQRFSAFSEPSFRQYVALSSVQRKCDIAIACAVESRKKESQEESDYYFEMAIRGLTDYDSGFYDRKTVDDPMEKAKQRDLENMKKPRNISRDHAMSVVEFHILSTLPDERPTVVLQALNCSPGNSVLPEILLNFSRFKGKRRLTLAQNPHFYGDLPTSDSLTRYVAGFNSQPTDCYTGTIYVVTNNSRRVFLEFGETRRAFDNVSVANNTLIF